MIEKWTVFFIDVLVAMIYKDSEEHKLNRKANFKQKETNKIDNSNKKFFY